MVTQPGATHSYPPNAVADAAWEIYENELRDKLEPEHYGRDVIIDTKSHDFEIEDQRGGAWVRLTDRHPDAVCYIYRIGYPVWWTREIHAYSTYADLVADAKANPLPLLKPGEVDESERQAAQAQLMYDKIRARLPADEKGKFLVLDLTTGDYEIDKEVIRADSHLRERRPDAKHVFQFRIGYQLKLRQTPFWCEE